eukprot:scaffold1694_cov413-Prasinococcus_capsulatus_cf.AAC.1
MSDRCRCLGGGHPGRPPPAGGWLGHVGQVVMGRGGAATLATSRSIRRGSVGGGLEGVCGAQRVHDRTHQFLLHRRVRHSHWMLLLLPLLLVEEVVAAATLPAAGLRSGGGCSRDFEELREGGHIARRNQRRGERGGKHAAAALFRQCRPAALHRRELRRPVAVARSRPTRLLLRLRLRQQADQHALPVARGDHGAAARARTSGGGGRSRRDGVATLGGHRDGLLLGGRVTAAAHRPAAATALGGGLAELVFPLGAAHLGRQVEGRLHEPEQIRKSLLAALLRRRVLGPVRPPCLPRRRRHRRHAALRRRRRGVLALVVLGSVVAAAAAAAGHGLRVAHGWLGRRGRRRRRGGCDRFGRCRCARSKGRTAVCRRTGRGINREGERGREALAAVAGGAQAGKAVVPRPQGHIGRRLGGGEREGGRCPSGEQPPQSVSRACVWRLPSRSSGGAIQSAPRRLARPSSFSIAAETAATRSEAIPAGQRSLSLSLSRTPPPSRPGLADLRVARSSATVVPPGRMNERHHRHNNPFPTWPVDRRFGRGGVAGWT